MAELTAMQQKIYEYIATCIREQGYPPSVREIGDKLRTIHVHDNMGDRDAHLWPTKGIIDWNELSNALNDIGFDGVFSLETTPAKSLSDEQYRAEARELFAIAKKIIG